MTGHINNTRIKIIKLKRYILYIHMLNIKKNNKKIIFNILCDYKKKTIFDNVPEFQFFLFL